MRSAAVEAEIRLIVRAMPTVSLAFRYTSSSAPQPLDEHVVPPCVLAVHADRNAVVGEQPVTPREPANRSVLKISGLPSFTKASCSVSMKAASVVIDARHHRTRRLPRAAP
jgi:hypothetical protein